MKTRMRLTMLLAVALGILIGLAAPHVRVAMEARAE